MKQMNSELEGSMEIAAKSGDHHQHRLDPGTAPPDASEARRELESLCKLYDFVAASDEYLARGEFSNLNEFHNFGRDEG
jgi:hypothetical protein